MNKLEQDVQNAILDYFHKYEDDDAYYSIEVMVYWDVNIKDKLTAEFIDWCDWYGKISIRIETGFQNTVCLKYLRSYKDCAMIEVDKPDYLAKYRALADRLKDARHKWSNADNWLHESVFFDEEDSAQIEYEIAEKNVRDIEEEMKEVYESLTALEKAIVDSETKK